LLQQVIIKPLLFFFITALALLKPKMYRTTTREDIPRFERAFAHRRDINLAEGAKGNDNTLNDQIFSAIYAVSGRIHSMDPPFLLDYDIHDLWHLFITAAKNYHRDNNKQSSLVLQILYLKEMGTLTAVKGEDCIVAKASNGQRMWTDLPWFIEDVCAEWTQSFVDMSTEQRCNLTSFIARLAAVGVGGNSFTGLALALFIDAFEIPRKLAISDTPVSNDEKEISIEELLPLIGTWTLYAPHKLRFLCVKEVKDFVSEQGAVGQLAEKAGVVNKGFSVARWQFWTKRIVELAQCDNVNVAMEAASMVDQMDTEDYHPL